MRTGRVAVRVLACATALALVGCGGGGGGTGTLTIVASDDGYFRGSDGTVQSDVPGVGIAVGAFSNAYLNGYARFLHTAELFALFGGGQITNVTLTVAKQSVVGTPSVDHPTLTFVHADFGASITFADFNSPLAPGGGPDVVAPAWSDAATLQFVNVDVTARVLADLGAALGHSDFEIVPDGLATAGTWWEIEDREGNLAGGPPPTLTVTYVP